jgi:SAM-dependent methyltransferase
MGRDLFMELLSPSTGERILDVGAGKGQVADRVVETSMGAELYAIDPNPRKVEHMKRAFPSIRSSTAMAESLPFPDSYFDKVYTTMALHHFDDVDRTLAEVARVLKQGGSFLILEVKPGSGVGAIFRLFGRLMGEHMNIMTRERLLHPRKGEGTEGRQLGRPWLEVPCSADPGLSVLRPATEPLECAAEEPAGPRASDNPAAVG